MEMKCRECDAKFTENRELTNHEDTHHVLTVAREPFVMLLNLPDGCTPGRWEAADAFVQAIAELQQKHPRRNFQFLPFSFNASSGGLDAILAIAQPAERERRAQWLERCQ